MNKFSLPKIFYFLSLFLLLELLSFLGYFSSNLNKLIFSLIICFALFLSLKELKYGLYIILYELVLGSKGYLFSWETDYFTISIRLGLFLTLFGVWLGKVLKTKFKDKNLLKLFYSPLFKFYFLFLLILFLGGLVGLFISQNNLNDWFLDINGFLYLGLMPVFYAAFSRREELISVFRYILVLVLFLSLKTLFLLYIFSHQIREVTPSFYRWVRVSGWGEITAFHPPFYRIFSQSHIFLILGLFLVLIPLIFSSNLSLKSFIKKHKNNLILFLVFLASFLASYSRSLWLGFGLALIFLIIALLFIFRQKLKELIKLSLINLSLFSLSLLLLALLINFPYPRSPVKTIAPVNLIGERISQGSQEPALATRLNLLSPLWREIKKSPLIGFGFGKTISFVSHDPRFLAQHPQGIRTTFAFEWGYLDLILKIGFLGLIVYLLFLFKIGQRLISSLNKTYSNPVLKNISFALLLTFIAELTLHTVTPYLNHPLGLSLIMITALWADFNQ
jgi:hypothetical protein